SELDDIAALVADRRPSEVTLLFSHGHWDHVLGRSWWPRASTVGHTRLAAELERAEQEIRSEAESLAAARGEAYPLAFRAFVPDRTVEGERALELGPWRLTLRDAPGHCSSQITAELPGRRLLFAADMLSDIEIPSLDATCEVYRRTLDGLFPLLEGGA